jgi:SAM-dependent methyltransferase
VRAGTLARKAILEPRRIPQALATRIIPSSRWGPNWLHLPDGSVTFRGGGFVAASTPQMLLARHNFELLRIKELLTGLAFNRSLEIGCGFGRLSMAFAEHSAHHVAVDINDEALALARSTYPNIDFRQASAAQLPFADGCFGLVSTWTVLQHIRPTFIQQAAQEVARVSSPGGTLLLCEETRLAGQPEPRNTHTWHRTVGSYRALFPSFTLLSDAFIDEIDRIPGMTSPGRVMLFRGT